MASAWSRPVPELGHADVPLGGQDRGAGGSKDVVQGCRADGDERAEPVQHAQPVQDQQPMGGRA